MPRTGRPPDLELDATPEPFHFTIVCRAGSPAFVPTYDRKKLSKFYALNQILEDNFPELEVVRVFEDGRRTKRVRARLPSAGVPDLIDAVRKHPACDLFFYADFLFNDGRGDNWSESDQRVAQQRTRSLISKAVGDLQVVRRFRFDGRATAIYFPPGSSNAEGCAKSAAEARAIHRDRRSEEASSEVDRATGRSGVDSL